MKTFGKSIQLGAIALASVIALTACGSDSNSSSTPTPTPTPTPGAAVSQGVVTAKAPGNVTVNGIQFSTTTATVKVDDNATGVPGADDALRVGMVVKVTGANDDLTKKGTATKIEARDALEGKIEVGGIDDVNKTITVMGQKVQIEDNLTNLNDDATKVFTTAGFAVDDTVEVHGFADDQGRLRATRVAKKQIGETPDFEIKGIVTTVGATSFTLSTPGRTGVLTVNFSTPLTAPAPNSLVEVKTLGVIAVGATTITASSIRLEDRLGAENEKVEVEGLVSSGTVLSFVVNGKQAVTTDASTVFEGGVKADFAPGVKIEAEGPLKNGVIVASKISFRSNIKIEADATTFTPDTSLTVLGKLVGINKFTTRIDNGPIAINSHVEVRAMPGSVPGTLVATRIIVQSASTQAFVQGPVTASDSAAGTLTILGFTLVSNTASEWRVSSTSTETPVTKAAFFAQLKTNSVVKVKWNNFTATTVAFKEAEIELGK